MKVNFCGDVRASSGYGEFARYFIYAIDQYTDIDLYVTPINTSVQNVNYGKKQRVVNKLLGKKQGKVDINVINMIPSLFAPLKKDAINVGFTMFETTKITDSWVRMCNDMDAIFVPGEWNRKVFQDSGVTKPIFTIPCGVDNEDPPSLALSKSGEFKFYSIFQWLERKNPEGLIQAFLYAFSGQKDVSLTLKTHVTGNTANDTNFISNKINEIRKGMGIGPYPKINLITKFLSDQEMQDIHNSHNAFVLLHRGEGWGMPHMEAMLNGNVVIATDFSETKTFMNENNSLPVKYIERPVFGIPNWLQKFHSVGMTWAEPDIIHAADQMRVAKENKQVSKMLGSSARQHVLNNFNYKNSAIIFKKSCEALIG